MWFTKYITWTLAWMSVAFSQQWSLNIEIFEIFAGGNRKRCKRHATPGSKRICGADLAAGPRQGHRHLTLSGMENKFSRLRKDYDLENFQGKGRKRWWKVQRKGAKGKYLDHLITIFRLQEAVRNHGQVDLMTKKAGMLKMLHTAFDFHQTHVRGKHLKGFIYVHMVHGRIESGSWWFCHISPLTSDFAQNGEKMAVKRMPNRCGFAVQFAK